MSIPVYFSLSVTLDKQPQYKRHKILAMRKQIVPPPCQYFVEVPNEIVFSDNREPKAARGLENQFLRIDQLVRSTNYFIV